MGAWAGLQRLWQPVGYPPGGVGSGAVNSSRDLRVEHVLTSLLFQSPAMAPS